MISRNFSFQIREQPKKCERIKYIIWCLKDNKYHGYVELIAASRVTGVQSLIGEGEYFGRVCENREETINFYKKLSESADSSYEYGGHYDTGVKYNMEEILDILYQKDGLDLVKQKYAIFYQDHRAMLLLLYDMYITYILANKAVPKLT